MVPRARLLLLQLLLVVYGRGVSSAAAYFQRGQPLLHACLQCPARTQLLPLQVLRCSARKAGCQRHAAVVAAIPGWLRRDSGSTLPESSVEESTVVEPPAPHDAHGSESDANKLSEADVLHAEKRFTELFDVVAPLAAAQPDNIELAWRSARAHHDLAGELINDAKRREELIREGLAIAEAALSLSPENGLCHKWVGILLGALGEFLPTKEKVANAFRIKTSLEKAASLRPEDGSVQLALGEWAYKVAGISWVERNAAKLLFGSPPEATYDEALGYYETALRLNPTKKAGYKAALTCDKLRRSAEVQEKLKAALALESVGEADAEIDRLCRAMLR